jgi:hypothetical protein
VSSLWTPGGERPVHGPGDGVDVDDDDDDLDEDLDEATVLAELDEARRRVASVPAADVVANHAMGLFELGAIHLGATPPNLADASLAIDALGALVDRLGDRLGDNASVLRDALAQIRLAYVQVKAGTEA